MGLESLRYTLGRLRGMARPPVTVTEPPAGVRFDRDVEVTVRDGTILRVNVFRPKGDEPVPVIMCAHPYGKDKLPKRRRFGYRFDPQYRLLRQPGPVSFSAWTSWEAPDPAFWVPRGYAVVNCDLRGCGSSDGEGTLLSRQEGEDYHDLIEWAGTREWSSGKVGLLGVSYLAISQYRAAAERPPHLAAICPWEGFTDAYRDLMRPGGIREDGFVRMWSRGVRNQRIGPDVRAEQLRHELFDHSWREFVPDLERIEVPMLVCASFSDHNLHSRGSFRAFDRVGSRQRWVYTHRGGKWVTFYSPPAKAAQKRFLDHYLKGEENGMAETPPVRLEVREDRDTVHAVHEEDGWPIPRTEWMELHLGAGRRLTREPAAEAGSAAFDTDDRAGTSFVHTFDSDTELSGPIALRLHLDVRGGADDVHLFAAIDKLRGGRRVPFEGSYGFGRDAVTSGWLKASHRELDPARSRPFEPVHRHADRLSLAPGEIVAVEIALVASSTLFRRGEQLRLTVRGRWPWRLNLAGQIPAKYEPSPRGTCVLHFGGRYDARLLVPVIPVG